MTTNRRGIAAIAVAFLVVFAWVLLRPYPTSMDTHGDSTEVEQSALTAMDMPNGARVARAVSDRTVALRAESPQRTVNVSDSPGDVTPRKVVDLSAMTSSEDLVALHRHTAVRHLMESPARDTSECRKIMEICQRHGMGPWAVAGSYDVAWEAAMTERIVSDEKARNRSEEFVNRLTGLRTRIQTEQRATLEQKLGVRFPDEMIAELSEVYPKVFLGMPPSAVNGEWMVDSLSWEEISQAGLHEPSE